MKSTLSFVEAAESVLIRTVAARSTKFRTWHYFGRNAMEVFAMLHPH